MTRFGERPPPIFVRAILHMQYMTPVRVYITFPTSSILFHYLRRGPEIVLVVEKSIPHRVGKVFRHPMRTFLYCGMHCFCQDSTCICKPRDDLGRRRDDLGKR